MEVCGVGGGDETMQGRENAERRKVATNFNEFWNLKTCKSGRKALENSKKFEIKRSKCRLIFCRCFSSRLILCIGGLVGCEKKWSICCWRSNFG